MDRLLQGGDGHSGRGVTAMNRWDWLDKATAKIYFRPDREAVRRELAAHFEDLREDAGLTEEAAVEAMGDPDALAEELGRLHRPWWGYLWRVSQVTLILAVLLFLGGNNGFGAFKDWAYSMPPAPEGVMEGYYALGRSGVSVPEVWHPVGTKELGHYRFTPVMSWLEQWEERVIDKNGTAHCCLVVCLRLDTWRFWELYPSRTITTIRAAADSSGRRYTPGQWPYLACGESGCQTWQGPFTVWYQVFLELPGPEDVPEWVDLSVGYGGDTLRVNLKTEVMS